MGRGVLHSQDIRSQTHMHRFFPAILSSTVLLMLGTAQADTDPDAIAPGLRAAVVGLSISDARKPRKEERSDEKTASSTHTTKLTAVGSGLLISADGLILTAASLLGPSGEVLASLQDGTKLKAEIVAKDLRLGLALLRISGPITTFVALKDTNLPTLGERLVAIGRTASEFDASPILTEGVTSAVGDVLTNSLPYIQTTAQLLPGMGGGPLVSQKSGEVVGINSNVYVNRGTGVSSTFAIPVRVFLRSRSELLAKGRVSRYVIGISTVPVTDELRSAVGHTGKEGVRIVSVREGGPAARAGLLPDDIVVKVNASSVPNAAALFEVVNAHGPAPDLTLVVFRRGSMTSITVQPEELLEK
jgi:serine protease Do